MHCPSTHLLSHAPKVRIVIPDHNCLGMIQNRVDIPDHQFGNVWNTIKDEVSVGPDQASYIYVFVIDAQIVAFTQESFDDFDHGAFP